MIESRKEAWIHRIFLIVVIGRGLYGLFEILVGLTLLLLTPAAAKLAHLLVQGELAEDPTDVVALFVNHAAENLLTGIPVFVLSYLLVYGITKIFLTVGLLQRKNWAYPISIILFSIFLIYQILRITLTHSLTLTIVTFFDFIAVLLITHEYYLIRKRLP